MSAIPQIEQVKNEGISEVFVQTIEGFYDEKAKAELHNINKRKYCFGHEFINASLHWTSGKLDDRGYYDITIEERHDDPHFGNAWGIGYGGIRFCLKCKKIDCIHIWGEKKVYKQQVNPYYLIGYIVDSCKICGRRILRQSWGDYTKVKKEAIELIAEVAKEYGTSIDRCGSGFSIELPMQVSLIMDQGGDARVYIQNIFERGHI